MGAARSTLGGQSAITMAAASAAVVSRIVPDEAVGRWEIQDLSRFQRRSCKAYSSGPILVAGGSHFGLLIRLGGKDTEFASELQVYAVNLSGKRTMGQHTIRVVNQTRGRDYDVVLSGEPGLWDAKSEWGWKQAMSLENMEDSEAGFVVDDTVVLELYMQVWEAEAVRTQGAPVAMVRPGAPGGFWGSSSFSSSALLHHSSAQHALASSSAFSLAADFGELLRSGRGADITVKWAGLQTCAAGTCAGLAACSGICGGVCEACHAAAPGIAAGGAVCADASKLEEPPLRAHRLVLATRSPVFERMLLSSGMREAQQGFDELYLEGADAKVASWFVRFIYTDEVPAEAWDDQEALCFLLALAHRYQVQSLLERCQARLVEQLSEESAPERLMMADLLDSPALKAAVLNFICGSHRRLARVQATEGFARLTKTRPQLLADLLATVVPPAAKRARIGGEDKQVG